jgi:copper transport protein
VRLFFAAACVLLAAEAAAHAELVSSSPADGASLAAAPAQIELRFNEPVRLLSIVLLDRAGAQVALAQAGAEGSLVRAALGAALADGHYTLSYRVTSLDSHPVAGAIAFGVGAGAPPPPAAAGPEAHPLHVAVRALRDLALLIAAGAALFMLAVGDFPRQRVLLPAAAAAGIACALAALGLQGTGLHSSFALSACVACAGLACIATGALTRLRSLLGLGAALALASLPLTGHALGAPLAMAALAAHGLAAAFWLGSLVALVLLLRGGAAAAALRRFSALGVPAVGLLLACGVTLAALRLDSLDALWRTPYGQLILAKSLLLALLIAVALANRFRLLPALERGDRRALPALRGTVAFELGALAIVVALTAALVQTPPRAAARELVAESAGRIATLSIAPGSVSVRLRDSQGAPLDAAEVTLELANPATGVRGLVRPMRREGAGHYRYEGESLVAATWRVTVHARIGDFEKLSFSF